MKKVGILEKIDNILSVLLLAIIIFGCCSDYVVTKNEANKTIKVFSYRHNLENVDVKEELNFYDGFKNGSIIIGNTVKTYITVMYEEGIESFSDLVLSNNYSSSGERNWIYGTEKEKGIFSKLFDICIKIVLFILSLGLFFLLMFIKLIYLFIVTLLFAVILAANLITIKTSYVYHMGFVTSILICLFIFKYSSFVNRVKSKQEENVVVE